MANKIVSFIKNVFGSTSSVSRVWGTKPSSHRKAMYSLAWYVYDYDYLNGQSGKTSTQLEFEHITMLEI